MTEDQHRFRSGLLLGLGAYGAWGILPLYFKALATVGPIEIVAHRIVWSLIFLAVLMTASRRWPHFKSSFRQPRLILTLALSATLIAANWLLFIWAITSGHVLAASLGYYLNPLVNVLLGVALLGERLSLAQKCAVGLAATGVAILAFGAAGTLWISLALAGTFATYGLVRKIAPIEAIEGLSIETLLLAPFAFVYLGTLQAQGLDTFRFASHTNLLLLMAGAVTALPLLMFTAAAKRLPYSTLGFIQFLAPTLQFLLAILIFGERLSHAHILCFAAIWTAVAIFASDGISRGRARRRRLRAEEEIAEGHTI